MIVGYGLVALIGLGVAALALVHGDAPTAGRVAALGAGLVIAAAVAGLARERLAWAVRIGVVVTVVAFILLDAIGIEQGWADADCQYLDSCDAPGWPWLTWLSLLTSVGAGALVVVARRLREGPHAGDAV